jgi:hypothetical protein
MELSSLRIMPGGLTPLEYANSRYPSDRNLHEIIAEPPRSDEEEELQPEQRRQQMYDRNDIAAGEIFVYSFSSATLMCLLLDDEAEGEGSSSETE